MYLSLQHSGLQPDIYVLQHMYVSAVYVCMYVCNCVRLCAFCCSTVQVLADTAIWQLFGEEKASTSRCLLPLRDAAQSFFPLDFTDSALRAFPNCAPAAAPPTPPTVRAAHPEVVSAAVPLAADTAHIAAPQGAASAPADKTMPTPKATPTTAQAETVISSLQPMLIANLMASPLQLPKQHV